VYDDKCLISHEARGTLCCYLEVWEGNKNLMGGIFLSYRHEDSGGYAVAAMYDRLTQDFGADRIFRDIDTIDLGLDFVEEIERAVSACNVLIAVIGREWLTTVDQQGKRRLENPDDWVRLEIETALNRNVRVIPALVDGALMPHADELPESLKKFARRQGVEISQSRFRADMDRLIHSLEKVVEKEGPKDTKTASHQESIPETKPPPVKPPENMVLIPKGPFLYGADRVREDIPYDYWLDIYPVTNEQFREFMLANGYGTRSYWSDEGWAWKEENNRNRPDDWTDPKRNKPDHPVVSVNYHEAEAFAAWAGKRLATEQEWEKAARGTDGREYPWGENFDKTRCNSEESGIKATTPVTKYSKGVSPFGCYDMAGNVWEWMDSWMSGIEAKAVIKSLGEDPNSFRIDDDQFRVIRGGSWYSKAWDLRAAYRYDFGPSLRGGDVRFRCAQDAP